MVILTLPHTRLWHFRLWLLELVFSALALALSMAQTLLSGGFNTPTHFGRFGSCKMGGSFFDNIHVVGARLHFSRALFCLHDRDSWGFLNLHM